MRKRLVLLTLLLLLFLPGARAESLSWTQAPDLLRPGKLMRLTWTAPDGATLTVLDTAGNPVLSLVSTAKGSLTWDGSGLTPGAYVLRLTCGGETADHPISVGDPAPVVEVLDAPSSAVSGWAARVTCSLPGTLTLTDDAGRILTTQNATEGENLLVWDGKRDGAWLPDGLTDVRLTLTDGTGYTSTALWLEVLLDNPQPARDATPLSPDDLSGVTCDHEVCYWTLPMGETDPETLWQVLTAPITVLTGDERKQVKVRREPDAACTDYVGEVTCESQGVHVVSRGEEWTLIEAYSSSVEGSSVAVWAKQFAGYVQTSLLKEVEVSQDIALVVDKLQQRLYVWRDGALYATLLCSTGYPTSSAPYNETPAGEFVTISWTGGFWSGNLYCDMAIRINDGILLHEVPCTITYDDTGAEVRDYSRCSTYLGEKASHGCIRIQREKSPEGVNAQWLWENLPRGKNAPAKVLIWDDVGRTLLPAEDGLLLYYNPNGGRNYHSSPWCQLVSTRFLPLTAFPYGALDEAPYKTLTPCPGCAPQLRRAEIEAINFENLDR